MLKRSLLVVGFILANLTSATSFAEEKNIGSHEGLKLSLIENGTSPKELKVNLPKSAAPNVMKLENPARLVIDLPGLSTNNNKTINLSSSDPLKSVRVGRHPNNTRLVFDLNDQNFPAYALSNDGKAITLTFSESASATTLANANSQNISSTPNAANTNLAQTKNTAAQNIAAIPTKAETTAALTAPLAKQEGMNTANQAAIEAKREISIKNSAANTSSPAIAAPQPNAVTNGIATAPLSDLSPAKLHSNQETIEAPKARLDSKTLIETPKEVLNNSQAAALSAAIDSNRQVMGTPAVNKIAFERDPSSQVMMIKISLSQRTPYTLSRTGQRAYRLALPQTIFADENLTLPHFPPQDFKGITLVNPERGNGQVEFFIGVERDIKLASFAHENEIWIKVDNSKDLTN